jgi:O-antigen/teichoic acid export membrane protein
MKQGQGDLGPQTTSGSRASTSLIRNTVWNVLGTGLPLILTLVTFPVLIRSIGTERFGVLMIAWVVLGYFGLFDLGLGRATIKFMAEAFEHGRVVEVRALFWTSLMLSVLLGLVGGGVLAALSPPLVGGVLNVAAPLQQEATMALYVMACAVPLVTATTAVRGTLEAQHRFGLLNVLQAPVSALTQASPLLALPFSKSLAWLVGAIVLSRLLGTAVFLVAALRLIESPFKKPFFLHERLRKLFSYGGWLTVTNVVGPLMVYADRFVIGALSSMTAVTYYATPYEAVTRLWLLPHSLTRTMFPIFSAGVASQRTRIYASTTKNLALILTPVVATIVALAPELLYLWVGENFARNSALVLQILAVGVLINSLAMIPFTLVQGVGRPDITAKFHLLELPFYLVLLLLGVRYWGIAGAAVAWTVRVGADGILLAFYVRLNRLVSPSPRSARLVRTMMLAFIIVLGAWVNSKLAVEPAMKVIVWGLVLTAWAGGVWVNVLALDERERLTNFVRSLANRATGSARHEGTNERTDE